jgi:hypothetical protein
VLARPASAVPAWADWQDLLNMLPDPGRLDAARAKRGRAKVDYQIQRIEDAQGPHVNFDLYAVEIARLPSSGPSEPETLMTHIRQNLNAFFDPRYSVLVGYEDADAGDWAKLNPAPLGALMQFNIPARVLGLPLEEQAAVIASASSATEWIFSPVTIGSSFPGEHPVSGNRQFGTRTRGGTVEVYTRAADRTIDNNKILPPSESDVFTGADNLWRSFQDRVVTYVNGHGGSAKAGTVEIHRPTWDEVTQSGLFTRA